MVKMCSMGDLVRVWELLTNKDYGEQNKDKIKQDGNNN